MNFDFKNGCKNDFRDNNEKSCSRFRNKVSHKIDLKAVWPRNGLTASVGVNVGDILKNVGYKISLERGSIEKY